MCSARTESFFSSSKDLLKRTECKHAIFLYLLPLHTLHCVQEYIIFAYESSSLYIPAFSLLCPRGICFLCAVHFWHSSNSLFDIFLFPTDLRVTGLGMVHVAIPSAIQSGRNAILTCDYELEDDDLYSVKWYRGKSFALLLHPSACAFYDVRKIPIVPFFLCTRRQERILPIHSEGDSVNKSIPAACSTTCRCKLCSNIVPPMLCFTLAPIALQNVCTANSR